MKMEQIRVNRLMPMPSANQSQDERSVKSSGKTVQDAIQQGLAQLSLTEDQVEIDVVKEGSRGILGFGAEDAVVVITPKTAPQPEPTALDDTPAVEVEEDSISSVADFPESESDYDQDFEADDSDEDFEPVAGDTQAEPIDQEKRAQEILETLLDKMSVKANVSVRQGDDLVDPGEVPPLTLDITGSDLGVLIGRRGETLRALQFVVRQILSKEAGRWVPVVVDVESYLVRRRKSLQQLAKRMAERAAFSKRKITLEPMSAQERRIIHLQLRDHDAVYTQSVGEGERRKVVIFPKQV
jgi:spoIIIJ-associated protein